MKSLRLFGTDGIRGTVGEHPLTKEMITRIAYAAGSWLKKSSAEPMVFIGRDTRTSGSLFEDLLRQGLKLAGCSSKVVGVVPTAALSYLVMSEGADMGIVISASHNASTDNGIKFFDRMGYKLSCPVEEEIENIIFGNTLKLPEALPAIENSPTNLAQKYLDCLMGITEGIKLSNIKVALDCANGAVSHFAPPVFKRITKEVTSLNTQPDGNNINLNCGSLYPEVISEAVKQAKADIGFAFDGDGDRVIAVDEEGKILDGDYIMAIMAIYRLDKDELPNRRLATTHMSNLGLDEALACFDAQVLRTNVGDRNVADLMRKENLVLGGEQSGHIILFDYANTGDGLITSLEFLRIVSEIGKPLSQLAQVLKKYPQQLVNIKVRNKRPINEIPNFSERIAYYQDMFQDKGRIFVRYSGTEPLLRIMIEARDEDLIKQAAADLSKIVTRDIGE